MKRIVTLLLSTILLLTATGCGSKSELEQLKKENEELKQQLNTSSSEYESAETILPTTGTSSAENELSMNNPFTVSTEYGTYKITLLSVTKKDWREKSTYIKYPTLVISYEVENIDFQNDYYSGCELNSNFFYVYNDNKSLLSTAGVSYDTTSPSTVLPGYKGKFDVCYDLEDETKNVDIIIHRTDENGKEIILGQINTEVK